MNRMTKTASNHRPSATPYHLSKKILVYVKNLSMIAVFLKNLIVKLLLMRFVFLWIGDFYSSA